MIDLINISIQFTGEYLFRDVNLKINSNDKIALVGSNGSGKTTLLKIINGLQESETGKIIKQKGLTTGYLPQEIVYHADRSLFKEVKSSLITITDLQKREDELLELLNSSINEEERDELLFQLGAIHHRKEDLGFYGIDAEIEKILIGLGFTEKDFYKLTNEFSGGWQMRIALAKLLLANPNILLLDEPTNHLDLDSLEWLITYLKSYEGALIIISHDRHFIDSVTEKTLEIFLHKVSTFNGNYESYLKFKEERDLQLENKFLLQQKKIKETERFIERFRYKATKAKQVQSRIKQLEKIELVELPDSEAGINLKFPIPPASGVIPIELIDVKKAFDDNIVFDGINFKIDRADKIAFVGPNGAGKTTLAKIVAGKINIDSGKRNVGYNTMISYYAQEVAENLDPSLDILQSIDNIAENKTIGQLRSILGSFLFTADDVFKKIEILSGGEKSRVALVRILLTKANLIVLDEPTNHLDFSSKLVLQKALINFTGTLILVSHDVDFLRPIVNKVLEIRRNKFQLYSGGIDYYLEKKKESFELQHKELSKTNVNITSIRKEQKRIEAELRQQRYDATKDLIKNIEIIEKQITQLEDKITIIEKELGEPSVFSNSVLAKEKNAEYLDLKYKLEQLLNHWTKLTEELEGIERNFKKE
jgi:ATP-binding cassette subfamily F protein 3